MRFTPKLIAVAAALALLLGGCTAPAPADPEAATGPDLDAYPSAELLRLLPTEQQLREHLLTPGRYDLDLLPHMDLDAKRVRPKDACKASVYPWFRLPVVVEDEAYAALEAYPLDTAGSYSPGLKVSVTRLPSARAATDFVNAARTASNDCAALGVDSGTSENRKAPFADDALYVSGTAMNPTRSSTYALVPLGNHVFTVQSFHNGKTGIPEEFEALARTYYEQLRRDPARLPAVEPGVRDLPLGTPARPGEESRIRIGISADRPGLGTVALGKASGFEADVARFVAADLGFAADRIDWVPVDPYAQEEALYNLDADLVLAGYAITPGTRENAELAGPYLTIATDILVRAKEPAGSTAASLSGRTMCAVTGTTMAWKLRKEHIPEARMVASADLAGCLAKLSDGGADAVAEDNAVLAGRAAQPGSTGKFRLMGEDFGQQALGIGMRQGTGRCPQINESLLRMVATGAWEAALKRNFGTLLSASTAPQELTCE